MSLVYPYAGQLPYLPPSRECEIFVCKIPRSVCEQELISMFEKYGDIFSLRLVHRGKKYNYAFVRFTNKNAVKVAVLQWNGYEIRQKHRISVCRSIDNKKLVLLNVPKYMSCEQIKKNIGLITTGLQDVQVFDSRNKKTINSGLAFLLYNSHTCAASAKKILNTAKYDGKKYMNVEWHTPGLPWDNSEFFDGKRSSRSWLGYYPIVAVTAENNFWAECTYNDLQKYSLEFGMIRQFSAIYSDYTNGY